MVDNRLATRWFEREDAFEKGDSELCVAEFIAMRVCHSLQEAGKSLRLRQEPTNHGKAGKGDRAFQDDEQVQRGGCQVCSGRMAHRFSDDLPGRVDKQTLV